MSLEKEVFGDLNREMEDRLTNFRLQKQNARIPLTHEEKEIKNITDVYGNKYDRE